MEPLTATDSTKPTRARRSSTSRSSRAGHTDTRSVVIAAALETICDLGYYQASSNEIARRAEMTWGVIQYHFGTREALLTAVLDDSVNRILDDLNKARISGRDRRMRLRQLLNLVLRSYGHSRYIAVLQILWNLARDPRTTEATEEAIITYSTRLMECWRRLLDDLSNNHVSDEAAWMVYTLMWGVAMEQAASSYISRPFTEVGRPPSEYRIEMTLDALEGVLDHDRG